MERYEVNVLTDINISWITAEKVKTMNIAAVLFTPILMQGKYRCRTAQIKLMKGIAQIKLMKGIKLARFYGKQSCAASEYKVHYVPNQ
jgi:hypothetical protein